MNKQKKLVMIIIIIILIIIIRRSNKFMICTVFENFRMFVASKNISTNS